MIINLPMPPSANALFANRKGGGRIKTKAYRDWIMDADSWIVPQKRKLRLFDGPMQGPINLTIKIPANTRGDASNRIKAAEDFLVSRWITNDDKHNWKVSVERDRNVECCQIEITPAEAQS